MVCPRTSSPRRPNGRRLALWAGLVVGGFLPSTGCQVEYAGMTLPSGKYMRDDVQYFAPGPNFPWANTQAATQRARMEAMGISPTDAPAGASNAGNAAPGSPAVIPVVPGQPNPLQEQEGRPDLLEVGGVQPGGPPAGANQPLPAPTPPPPPPGNP
ncbi:hypothetical protein EP7_000390 [Isosphaeraceae bacterium EP7]